MDESSDAEFERRATAASNAFENLRAQLEDAHEDQFLPAPGDVIGRYEIVRELGQGGFGSVFEVRHQLLGHRFAMKVLNPLIANDGKWVKRFREEARVTSLISHENIVYVTDFGEDARWGSYFVMELLEGSSLEDVLSEEGQQSPERVVRFAHAAAGAFAAVHEMGIVHCDLKPSNVFTVPRPRQPELWKFLDLGTSTVVMASVQTNAMYGTPVYMAPEQSIGANLTPLADQFSIACIVYEMLTGEPPWRVENWLQATAGVRGKRVVEPPSNLSDECPKAWDDIVMRGFALDPAERWPNLEMFARALENALPVAWEPAADPLDVAHVSKLFGVPTVAPGPSAAAPSVVISDGPSMVVDVDSGEESDERARVCLEFQSRERFMREVHRNLSVGGLFVPSDELLPLRSSVQVELRFTSQNLSVKLGATVVGHQSRAAGRGFGLAVEPGERKALDDFIQSVRDEQLAPDTKVFRTANPLPASLSPAEWFLLSRCEQGATIRDLSSLCAGLPIDVGDVAQELIEQGLLSLNRTDQLSTQPTAGVSHLGMDMRDVAAVLARADFFRHQANFLGARELLKRALQLSPDVADFHHHLSVLQMEFEGDAARAIPAARRAVELDPSRAEFREYLDYLTGRK